MATSGADLRGGEGAASLMVEQYPTAYRLAVGLSGQMAERVVGRVLWRATALAPRWGSARVAERWFLRFTVLESRAADRLGPAAGTGLDWLGPLSFQQREAVVLAYGLKLDLHRVAAAMDCSSSAAANHLVAATALLQVTGPWDAWTADLPARLTALVPPPMVVAAEVARAVRRRRWRTAGRWAATSLFAGVAIALGWGGWHLWQMLVF